MADDNTARYRSNDTFGRGPAAPATDPLTELARLIGRNDPFSEYGRTARPAAPPPQPAPEPGARYDSSLPPPPPPHPAACSPATFPPPPFHSERVHPYAQEPAAQVPAEPAPPRYSPEP